MRAGKYIDWQQLACTPLTGELASCRHLQMPVALASKRIYYALHEAAHLVASAHFGVQVQSVALINHRGHFSYLNEPGPCAGSVRTFYTADIPNAAVAFAGFEFESLYCDAPRNIAAVEDLLAGLQTLCAAARSPFGGKFSGAGSDDLEPETRRICTEVSSLLVEHWPVVDACATALLLFTDAKGVLNRSKADELVGHLRRSLHFGLPMSHRSRTPEQLAERLGADITTYWRGFVCIDDTEKYAERVRQVEARHRVDDFPLRITPKHIRTSSTTA